MTTKPFRAFISYSQQDIIWARRLQRWLESYRVPVGAIAAVDVPLPLGRFFRDEVDMAAASDIAVQVREAITNAESLIVICSPRSAKSKWVNAEIHHFRKTGRADKVFAFIIDGIPNSGDDATECFPPSLRAAGDPGDPNALPIEPLGLDVRKDGRARACARLAAGLLGIDFDDLWQRDRRRAERRQQVLIGSLAAVGLVFALISAAAIRFALQSEERAAILAIDTGRARLAEGQTDEALLVLLDAAKQFKDEDAPADLLIAFDEALQRAAAETVITLPVGARVFDAPNGYYIHDPATDDLLLLDSAEPPRVVSRATGQPFFAGDAPDGSLILVKSDFRIERRVNDRIETLGAFSPPADGPTGDQLRLDLESLQFERLEMYPIARDGMLKFGHQYFDLDARTLYQVTPFSQTFLQTLYAPTPNGSGVLFGQAVADIEADRDADWTTSVAPIDAQEMVRTRSEGAFAELLGYRCWGEAQVHPETKRQFAEAVGGVVAIDCTRSGGFLLLSVYAQMAGAAVRHDFLLDLSGEAPMIANRAPSPRIQHILADRLEDVLHTYVSGAAPEGLLQRQFKDAALRSVTYTEEELDVRFGREEDRILALASFRDVLVDTPDLRYYWRMPKEALSVRFLNGNLVGVLDALDAPEGDPGAIRAVRVLDFSSPHLYASRPYIEDANDEDRREGAKGISIEIEEFDDKNSGAFLYSAQAGRTYRRLGAGYNFGLWAEFRNADEVHLSVDGAETLILIHTLSEAVAAAKAALAPKCTTFRGDAFRQSACWPAQLAE